jgi:carbon monoxide dehydrogenase subunit G
MTKFESQKTIVETSAQEVFQFLYDVNNHQKLMPSAVTDWWSNEEEAKLKIQGLGSLHLKRTETINPSFIKIIPEGKAPVDLHLEWNIENTGIGSAVSVTIFADLNMMMKMVASKPLQNLADYMSAQVKIALAKSV